MKTKLLIAISIIAIGGPVWANMDDPMPETLEQYRFLVKAPFGTTIQCGPGNFQSEQVATRTLMDCGFPNISIAKQIQTDHFASNGWTVQSLQYLPNDMQGWKTAVIVFRKVKKVTGYTDPLFGVIKLKKGL